MFWTEFWQMEKSAFERKVLLLPRSFQDAVVSHLKKKKKKLLDS